MNNPKEIIVSSNEITFDKTAYDASLLGGIISKEEFEIIIDKINKIAIDAFFDSKKDKSHSIYKSTKIIIIINTIFSILIMLFIAIDKFFLIAVIMLIISIISILGDLLYIYNYKITHLNNSDLYIKVYIEKYLKELNKRFSSSLLWKYEPFKKKIIINIINDN